MAGNHPPQSKILNDTLDTWHSWHARQEASSFLSEIQGMKAKQITDRVNQLVRARKISKMSRKRKLWIVLRDYGLYEKSESNWNSQVD